MVHPTELQPRTNTSAEALTPEQKRNILEQAHQWLIRQKETAHYRFVMTLLVLSLGLTAVIAEQYVARAAGETDMEQTSGQQATPTPESETYSYNRLLGHIRGELIQTSFSPYSSTDTESDRRITPEFYVLQMMNIEGQFNLGFGLGIGDYPVVFELLPDTYRGWVENTPQFQALAEKYPNQKPSVGAVLYDMVENTTEKDGEQVVTSVTTRFVMEYKFSKDQGLTTETARAEITFTIAPNSNGKYTVTAYEAAVTTPQSLAEATPTATPVVEAAPGIGALTTQDLVPFGKEVVQQMGEVLTQQVYVSVNDFNRGLPPFAMSLYPQLHTSSELAAVKTKLNEQQQQAEWGSRDVRFGAVAISEDGAELTVADAIGGKSLLALRVPDGYSLTAVQGITPTVEAANPDGTLIAIRGVRIEGAESADADETESVLVFRWQAAQGATEFAKALGASVDQDVLTTIEGPSVQAVALENGERVIGFNDGLFGVTVNTDGVTFRQLAVDTGFDSLTASKVGTSTKVTGSYPEQPFTAVVPFSAFQNADVPLAAISGVAVTEIAAETAPNNAGPATDTLVHITFVGTVAGISGSNVAFEGAVDLLVSTGQVGFGRTAKDATQQYSVVMSRSAQMSMVKSGR